MDGVLDDVVIILTRLTELKVFSRNITLCTLWDYIFNGANSLSTISFLGYF